MNLEEAILLLRQHADKWYISADIHEAIIAVNYKAEDAKLVTEMFKKERERYNLVQSELDKLKAEHKKYKQNCKETAEHVKIQWESWNATTERLVDECDKLKELLTQEKKVNEDCRKNLAEYADALRHIRDEKEALETENRSLQVIVKKQKSIINQAETTVSACISDLESIKTY